jgi:hypothetical protein
MGGSVDDLAQKAASGSSGSVSVYHGLFTWEKGQLAGMPSSTLRWANSNKA